LYAFVYNSEHFFPEHDVRFVAVNDGVDTLEGEDEFMPFRNIMNEWYARDISRKVRTAHRVRGSNGEPLTTKPPYGYMKDPANPKQWIVVDETAKVVQQIYRMFLEGHGIEQIATILEQQEILTPNAYTKKRGIPSCGKVSPNGQYAWKHSTIQKILQSREYCGDLINFKTYSKSYKNKRRLENAPENWMIFENAHKAIIDRDTFERVQERYGKTRQRQTQKSEKSMFSGLLKCSTCGTNLGFHFNQKNHDITYFNCATYNNRGKKRGQCDSTHYIRTDFLEQIVLGDIKRITAFAKHYEDELLKILTASIGDEVERQIEEAQREILALKARNRELDGLFERLYEDSVSGKISEERFAKMSARYEREQAENERQLEALRQELVSKKGKAGSANEFLKTVKRYTRMRKLTPEILREFVDKIVVHHRQRLGVASKDNPATEEQKVEIFYNCVGKVEVPDLAKIPPIEINIPTRKGVTVSHTPTQNVVNF
jgi:hypothetical protein